MGQHTQRWGIKHTTDKMEIRHGRCATERERCLVHVTTVSLCQHATSVLPRRCHEWCRMVSRYGVANRCRDMVSQIGVGSTQVEPDHRPQPDTDNRFCGLYGLWHIFLPAWWVPWSWICLSRSELRCDCCHRCCSYSWHLNKYGRRSSDAWHWMPSTAAHTPRTNEQGEDDRGGVGSYRCATRCQQASAGTGSAELCPHFEAVQRGPQPCPPDLGQPATT